MTDLKSCCIQSRWEYDPIFYVPVRASRRKLQALAYVGWRSPVLARWAGIGKGRLEKVLQTGPQERHFIKTELADIIEKIFDHFIDVKPPNDWHNRLRAKQARKLGFLPVDRWVDIDNDEAPIPLYNPLSREGRKRQWAYIMEEYRHLIKFGINEDEIACRLGIQPSTLHSNIQRYRRR